MIVLTRQSLLFPHTLLPNTLVKRDESRAGRDNL
jgi:hypothetical protein